MSDGTGILALAAIGTAGAAGTAGRGDLATGLLVGGLLAGGGGRHYDRGYCGWNRGGASFAEGYLLGSRSSWEPGWVGGYGGPWGGYGGYGGPWSRGPW
jgi:hypothetical protein